MIEAAKVVFIALLTLAMAQIGPGLKDFKEARDMVNGDTTQVYLQNKKWEQSYVEALKTHKKLERELRRIKRRGNSVELSKMERRRYEEQ